MPVIVECTVSRRKKILQTVGHAEDNRGLFGLIKPLRKPGVEFSTPAYRPERAVYIYEVEACHVISRGKRGRLQSDTGIGAPSSTQALERPGM